MNEDEPDDLLQVTLASIGDAVIATDPEGRVTFLNAVAEGLTGWTTSEARGQSLATVFRILNEHTREPVENPVEKVLRLGQIVGLANHTVLIAKDGTEVPIDDSAAPIRDPKGRLRGVVLVFRDITDRKRAEDAAAERHRITALRADLATALAVPGLLQPGLQACCEGLVRHLGMAFARIWTIDAESDVLELQASAGLYTHLDGPHSRVKVGEFKIGRIAASRQPHLTNDVPHDPNVSDLAWAASEGMVSFAGYPLVVAGRVLGVLAMFARKALTESLLDDLAPLAEQIALYVDRKRADETLQFQLDLTRSITDNATTAIFMMNDRSRCTFMNPAAEAMTGFSFAEVGGGILHDFIHHHRPDGTPYPMPECPIDRALPEHFEVRNHEDLFFRKSGEAFPVMCNARVIYKEGKAVGTVIEVRDTTGERKSADAARKRSEQLRRLADVATRIGVAHDVASVMGIITEEIRNVVEAHQSVASMTVDQDWAQAITAVSISEKYGRWKHYDKPPDGSGIYSLVCRTNRPMRMTQTELEAHPAWKRFGGDRDHPPMRGWLAAPLVGRDGQNLGLIQVSDKSEGEFTEDDEAVLVQLAQMASVAVENARLVENLRNADRRKDEFLATLAHELRNPLAPIRMGLEVMKLSGDAESTEQTRSMMERQTHQLITLVDDLLDVSRITQGKLELRRCRVTLSDVVRSAVEASRPLIDEVGHDLTVAVPDRPIHVEADPNRLAQVISNLLNNAAKYTPEGGQIRLSVERQGSDVLVSVRDNGIGIPLEMQRRVFEMFAQLDRPLEKGYVGLGIGLTLVKRLVEMHGGGIEVRSEGSGKGSEFTVHLPILVEPHAEERRNEPPPEAAKIMRRVLIVDDNKAAAEMLGMVVKMLGNEVRTASDGQEAVEVAAEYLPDVVLMDIGMPKLNGYEAARHIRQHPWGQSMMLVALTGWGQDEDRQRTKEAGFDHHLVKPAEPAALQRLLADVRTSGGSRT